MLIEPNKLNNNTFSFRENRYILVLSILFVLCFFACSTPVLDQLEALNTANEKIDNLKKSKEEVKALEDIAALSRETEYLLEYEYPIKEDELYVITYRFDVSGCFQIKLDTYFNSSSDAKKLSNRIIKNISSNSDFGESTIANDIYTWSSTTRKINIELNTQSEERGMINLIIRLTK